MDHRLCLVCLYEDIGGHRTEKWVLIVACNTLWMCKEMRDTPEGKGLTWPTQMGAVHEILTSTNKSPSCSQHSITKTKP
jgi:hypothetical protein